MHPESPDLQADNAAQSDEALWMLTGQVSDNEPVRDIMINALPFRIGRQTDLQFCIPSPKVSNSHAEILDDDGQIAIRDLESTNGTYVNGKPAYGIVPIAEGDLIQFANAVFRLRCQRPTGTVDTIMGDNCDRAMALLQFDRLMNEKAVVPFFQPIVNSSDESVHGYEILGRSHLFGLKMPSAMFQAASQLNLEAELSRMCRLVGLQTSEQLPGPPHVFVNTHPLELKYQSVFESSLNEVRDRYPTQSITVEIHESSVTHPVTMMALRSLLEELDIGLAYDDFGAGQARLLELVEVPPDYLKFDISLINGINAASAQKQNMLSTLVRMVKEMGISTLAEGIETKEEAETCGQLGFEYFQGFHFGRPQPASAYK